MSLRLLGQNLDGNSPSFFLDSLTIGILHRYIKCLILDLL